MRTRFIAPFLLFGTGLMAQSTFLPRDPDLYHWITRASIRTSDLDGKFHSAVQPYSRKRVVALFDSLQARGLVKSRQDQFQLRYFRETNSEWTTADSSNTGKGIWKGMFKRPADILSYSDEEFDVHANIVGDGTLGRVSEGLQTNTMMNTRGVEVRGTVGKRVGFYTFMTENQVLVPDYVTAWTNRYNSVPHEGFWKRYSKYGYDFFTARGHIAFQALKQIDVQIGHDRLHVGNGHRSLILSDFGNNYSFVRVNTQVWKIQYTNLYANLKTNIDVGPSGTPGSRRIPDKFFFFHRLGINIGKKLNFGMFEAIVAGRESGGVDLAYLNPLIFYRSIEQNAGSPDNAGLGFDIKWDVFKSVRLYGQVLLDEFLLKEMKAQNGWWGNKYALQAGAHYINAFGISNLDIQAEINFVRPFTYTHLDSYRSYSHYSQPLAHPLGANFREFIWIIRYQPIPRLNLVAKTFYFEKGEDGSSTGTNFGGNVLRSYAENRSSEYGNEVGQGLKNSIILADFQATYQPFTNFFIDATVSRRNLQVTGFQGIVPVKTQVWVASMGVRWNIARRVHEF